MSAPEIIALGSINVDFQVRVDHWPEPGETVIGTDFCMLPGGKAANVAYLARRLGAAARLIGRVGDDPLAEHSLRPLEESGVDLRGVQRRSGYRTAVSMIAVPPDAHKGIILAPNANDQWEEQGPQQAAQAVASAAAGSVLVVDLEVPVAVVQAAMKAARERGFAIVLDPSPADRFESSMADVSWMTPNQAEAGGMAGMSGDTVEDAFEAAARLHDGGVAHAVVKLRDGGCVVVGDGLRERVESGIDAPLDTTGAGDAFAGALAVAVLEGRSPLDCVRFAVAAADHTVCGWGSQPAYPDRDVLEQRLRALPGV